MGKQQLPKCLADGTQLSLMRFVLANNA